MATYHAISATGKSIVGLLSDNCPKPEFTGAEFKLWQSADFRQSKRLDFEQMNAVCELVQIQQQPSIVYVARPVSIQLSGGQTVIVGREGAHSSRGKSSRTKPGA